MKEKIILRTDQEVSYFRPPITNLVPDGKVSLLTLSEMIRSDETLKRAHEHVLQFQNDAEAFREAKGKFLSYVTPDGVFTERNAKTLVAFSGFYPIDIDKMKSSEEARRLRDLLFNDAFLRPVLAWVSPSGLGVKLFMAYAHRVMPDPSDVGAIKEAINALQEEASRYIQRRYLPVFSGEVDPSGKDLARACYLCHDAEAKYRDPRELLTDHPQPIYTPTVAREINQRYQLGDKSRETKLLRLRELTEAVEAAGVDIAYEYGSYIDLLFAIANDCAEEGREYAHRLCALCPKYQADHLDKVYDNALKSGNGQSSLGTAFWLAQQQGVTVTVSPKQAKKRGCDEDTSTRGDFVKGVIPAVGLPTFQSILATRPDFCWPFPLYQVCQFGKTDMERDVLWLGGMTVVGATVGENLRTYYGDQDWYANFLCFIVAPAAAGKSVIKYLKHLAKPLDSQIRAESEARLSAYERDMRDWEANGRQGDMPQKPNMAAFLISPNNSGTGIMQNIIDSGGRGLIVASEADTLSSSINTDYGNFGDTLRNVHDHAGISFNRRTNSEYRETAKTFVSMLISGTGGQVKPLIPSAENGLFSRILFYFMRPSPDWIPPFRSDRIDWERRFIQLGEYWEQVRKRMESYGRFVFEFSAEQQVAFNKLFSALTKRLNKFADHEMRSTLNRLGINITRLCALTAYLRAAERPIVLEPYVFASEADRPMDDGKEYWLLRIDEEDFQTLLQMVDMLYSHDSHILSFLRSTEVVRTQRAERFGLLSLMPSSFTRADFIHQAVLLNVKEGTADYWLNDLVNKEVLEKTEYGKYRRV